METNYYVYLHTNLINGKKYVGITSQEPEQRWKNGKGYKGQHFSNAIKKYGWNNFKHEVLYSNLSETKAKILEVSLIHFYESADPKYGYNVSEGGDIVSEETKNKISKANKGKVRSEETRKKLSESLSGVNNPNYGKRGAETSMYGRHLSEEHKAKISEANSGANHHFYGKRLSEEHRKKLSEAHKGANNPNYGRHLSEEHRKKISEANSGVNSYMYGRTGAAAPMFGKTHTEEAKIKMSEAKKGKYTGKNHPNYGKTGFKNPKSKSCICITTGLAFGSTAEAAKYYNINNSSIAKCCNGKLNHCGKHNGQKLKWKYIRDLKKPPMSESDKQHLRDIRDKFYKINNDIIK